MRFLFMAAFQPIADSGAAGSLFAVGAALQRLGHEVEFEWEPAGPLRVPNATASRILELPRRQLTQAAARLSRTAYDVVIISQPFAYLAYERLTPRFPRTLFLNRTHGWEARLYDAQEHFGFGQACGRGGRIASRISAVLHRRACRRAAHASRAVIAPASLCAEYIRSAYGLAPERVPVIPYGLDAASTAPARAAGSQGRRLLFAGSYLPGKGSRILERLLPPIAGEFPDASVTFVTVDTARPRLEQCYRSAFGSRLSIHSWMPRDALRAMYSTHDILLFPSLFEGFGKVWMEAMSAGVCVVGFAEGGLPDVAREGEALTCAAGDVSTLGQLLRSALQDPVRCAEIGRRGQERVTEFSWERNARETVDLCRRLARS